MNDHQDSVRLTAEHIAQLEALSATTGERWEVVLNEALSEYRGLVGVDPPSVASPYLDVATRAHFDSTGA